MAAFSHSLHLFVALCIVAHPKVVVIILKKNLNRLQISNAFKSST